MRYEIVKLSVAPMAKMASIFVLLCGLVLAALARVLPSEPGDPLLPLRDPATAVLWTVLAALAGAIFTVLLVLFYNRLWAPLLGRKLGHLTAESLIKREQSVETVEAD